MRGHVVISVAAHIGLVVVIYSGFPNLFDRTPSIKQAVPVEVVTIASETLMPALSKDEHVDRQHESEPEPQALPQPPNERPEKTRITELKPGPNFNPKSTPELTKPAAKPKKEVIPLPIMRPKPSGSTFDVEHIAALIDKSRSDVLKRVTRENEKTAENDGKKNFTQSSNSRMSSRMLSVSEIDFIRQQYYRCWSIPAGAKDAQEMVVTIHIFLNPDGSLQGVPRVIELARMNQVGEEFFRTVAESALRAVHKCNPLSLPSDDYDKWREIELTFNPREMLG